MSNSVLLSASILATTRSKKRMYLWELKWAAWKQIHGVAKPLHLRWPSFEKTKRVVCVSVTKSSGSHTHTVLLNYLNAPHVYIWSAVVASCALPGTKHAYWASKMTPVFLIGLLPPVTLLAKNKFGEPVEAFPSGTCWMDGSVFCVIHCSLSASKVALLLMFPWQH